AAEHAAVVGHGQRRGADAGHARGAGRAGKRTARAGSGVSCPPGLRPGEAQRDGEEPGRAESRRAGREAELNRQDAENAKRSQSFSWRSWRLGGWTTMI